MPGRLILVDERNRPVGTATWEEAHASPGKLHRAFSAYVFRNHGDEILIQKRSAKKPLWSGIWANTCCSHPREGEEITEIAPRRLQEEFGFTCPLTPHSSFIYHAQDPKGNGAEFEHVTMLRGDVDDVSVQPNPDEVGDWKWMRVADVKTDMEKNPDAYAPWFHIGLRNMTSLHVAIIPDGNRRWARKQMLQPWKGHERSAEHFRDLLQWIKKDGRVRVLTLWCFSTENWKRDPDEVAHLMEIFQKYLRKERASLKQEGIRLVHSGRLDRLSPEFRSLLKELCDETAANTNSVLHLALDYGGKDEILRAMNKIGKTEATEETLRAQLDHPELPDIDLIIRTSGEQRTSNFFLWQSAYAEWMFIEKPFPEFGGDDLGAAVDDFQKRNRRFGA